MSDNTALGSVVPLWGVAPGETLIGAPVGGGTPPAVLFVDALGNLGQDPTRFSYDAMLRRLLLAGGTLVIESGISTDNAHKLLRIFEASDGKEAAYLDKGGTWRSLSALIISGSRTYIGNDVTIHSAYDPSMSQSWSDIDGPAYTAKPNGPVGNGRCGYAMFDSDGFLRYVVDADGALLFGKKVHPNNSVNFTGMRRIGPTADDASTFSAETSLTANGLSVVPATLAWNASLELDLALRTDFDLNAATGDTSLLLKNLALGKRGKIAFQQDAGGGHAITWAAEGDPGFYFDASNGQPDAGSNALTLFDYQVLGTSVVVTSSPALTLRASVFSQVQAALGAKLIEAWDGAAVGHAASVVTQWVGRKLGAVLPATGGGVDITWQADPALYAGQPFVRASDGGKTFIGTGLNLVPAGKRPSWLFVGTRRSTTADPICASAESVGAAGQVQLLQIVANNDYAESQSPGQDYTGGGHNLGTAPKAMEASTTAANGLRLYSGGALVATNGGQVGTNPSIVDRVNLCNGDVDCAFACLLDDSMTVGERAAVEAIFAAAYGVP